MRTPLLCAILLFACIAPLIPGHASVQPPPFDHRTTGFRLVGRHRNLPCTACHVHGIFRATPRTCAGCHGADTLVRAPGKPPDHILTSSDCAACHTPASWVPAVHFDHTQVRGSCASCHNNVQAQGENPGHIVTTLQCNACHNTVSWSGAFFAHTGIRHGCASCHNGAAAVGMAADHVPTNGAPCEDCHMPTQFTTFNGAIMDHAVVAGTSCSTCHEAGRSFAGVPPVTTRPPPPHPTAGDCVQCHSTTNWNSTTLPAGHIPLPSADAQNCALCHTNPTNYGIYVMSHANITNNCAQCHAAGLSFANIAPPQLVEMPSTHIPTNGAPCEDCHSSTQFTTFDGASMDHTVVASLQCTRCHEAGKSFPGTPTVTTRPPSPHPTTGNCAECHTTTNWDAEDMPGNHVPLPTADAQNCALCHTNPGNYAVYTMNHVNITGNCAQCHATGLSFANIGPPQLVEMPTTHIPTNGAPCEDCHSPTQFTTFDGSTMDHTVVASLPCTTCHEAGKTFPGTPVVQTRPPPPHAATGDCSECHTTSSWDSNEGGKAMPPPHSALAVALHTPAMSARLRTLTRTARGDLDRGMRPGRGLQRVDHGQLLAPCASCHNGVNAVGPPAGHPATSANCSDCHTTYAWLPVRFDHAAIVQRACTTCHDGVHAVGKPSNHVTTTLSCNTCHGTLAWRPVRVDHAMFAGNCASCHNNVAAVGKPIIHVKTQLDCSACHTYPDWNVILTRRPVLARQPSVHPLQGPRRPAGRAFPPGRPFAPLHLRRSVGRQARGAPAPGARKALQNPQSRDIPHRLPHRP